MLFDEIQVGKVYHVNFTGGGIVENFEGKVLVTGKNPRYYPANTVEVVCLDDMQGGYFGEEDFVMATTANYPESPGLSSFSTNQLLFELLSRKISGEKFGWPEVA